MSGPGWQLSELIKEIRRHANDKAARFAYPWPLWLPWFPRPKLVPKDLKHYLTRCLFVESLMSVRTVWTADEFDIEYSLEGGLRDALELDLVPFGADTYDYVYCLGSQEILTFKPFTYGEASGPERGPESWPSLDAFFVDALQAEQRYSPLYIDHAARARRAKTSTRRTR